MPRSWEATGLKHQSDIKVLPNSRLRAKVLFFTKQRDLVEFWKSISPHLSMKGAWAVVTRLAFTKASFDGVRERVVEMVDPRYFCVMGFCIKHLSMEVITHEAVHAAYAYASRVKYPWPNASENDEELVCYPAGRIAAAINRVCHRERLYHPSSV